MIPSAGSIYYRPNYKYILNADWWVQTAITGYEGGITEFAHLSTDGKLTLLAGFAWDGPSGPAADTSDTMRGSLAHDALYKLLREGQIPESCREIADRLLVDLCREDGMTEFRAAYFYAALRDFGAQAASTKPQIILEAPARPASPPTGGS